ncbi:MAG: HigA family addiction module antidote protein [Magnetococcales bacterium]|nr:HigA family addiction module antidote protein [Magnetococcales bacterium]
MNKTAENRYVPDYAVHPGEILEEYLTSLGMTQTELSHRTGIALKHINEIIKTKAPVTPDTALKLERVFGRPAHFWNNLERLYEEVTARLADRERLVSDLEWLKRVPVKKMIEYGWIRAFQDMRDQLSEVLRFFGIASREQWATVWKQHQAAAAYRQSQKVATHAEAISAWLRQGEIEAQEIQCPHYDRSRFKKSLEEARQLTVEPPVVFQQKLIELCAQTGVAVVFVPELPKTGISGATRWLTSQKALIQLSLRYKSDDALWFTFFHEAGHVLLHGKRDVFLEGANGMDEKKEDQANRYAADALIPSQQWRKFVGVRPFSLEGVRNFASELGIAPGIVVGRMQHEKFVEFSWGNDLKQRFQWKLPNQEEEKVARGQV